MNPLTHTARKVRRASKAWPCYLCGAEIAKAEYYVEESTVQKHAPWAQPYASEVKRRHLGCPLRRETIIAKLEADDLWLSLSPEQREMIADTLTRPEVYTTTFTTPRWPDAESPGVDNS